MSTWARGGQVGEWVWVLREGGERDVKSARNGCVGAGKGREMEGLW